MLHYDKEKIKNNLFKGLIGLEKEGLRVDKDGFFARTSHPFDPADPYIVRDFCENQTEINTAPMPSAEEAYDHLMEQTLRIKTTLFSMDDPEYLWPFSNPPYIINEESIPIARFFGDDYPKTEYREYLAKNYGRYKMTFSGIHFNYSFSDELLQAEFEAAGAFDYKEFKDSFYVSLAAAAFDYNWLIVAITAASPLLDSSYFEKGKFGRDVYNGMASSRCSDIGYWNLFTPILDYSSLTSYIDSIDFIVKNELIRSYAELYLPVRVKTVVGEDGVKHASHLELRMIDLNPLDEAGMNRRDVEFLQMLLVFLACKRDVDASAATQINFIANTKNAARFDLKTVHLAGKNGAATSIADAAIDILCEMRKFYEELGLGTRCDETILFELSKFLDIQNRYAWQIRERFSDGFVKKGMQYVRGDNAALEEDLKALLYDKYIAPTINNKKDFIGIEIEMPIINLAKEAVDFGVVFEVTEAFVREFSLEPIKLDDDGHICLAESKKNGDSISFDCSYNNLELSLGRVSDITEADRRFREYYDFLQKRFFKYGYTLTGMGINPYRIYNRNEPVPNERYRMLFHHLHSYGKYTDMPMYFHAHPEFGTFASASQVQLDINYDEIPEVINTFSLLEPIKALLFSNSILLGENEDYLCYRDILWENSTHGINPHNVGPYECVFKDTDEFLEYILSTSIYCVMRRGKYLNFAPIPLRDYFSKNELTGEYYSDGKYESMSFSPEKNDMEYLRLFKHEDLTFRGTLEFRSVCCQPIKDAMSVAAFHVGLKRRLHELTDMLTNDNVLYHRGYNATELRHLMIKKELPSFVDRDAVYDLAARVVRLACDGLKERGKGEEEFIKCLFERVEQRITPAAYMADRLASGVEIEALIREFA